MRRSGLQVQFAAIHALFKRELLTRFGKFRLGYFWALLEPAIHVGIMLALFSAVMLRTVPGMPYALFLVNGILPWFMFSKTASRALSAVDANKGLFNYRAIRPIDTVIARALLEGFIYFLVYALFMFGLVCFGVQISVDQIPLLLLGWISLWLLSLGFSFVMMVIGHWSAEIGKFVAIFMRMLYFTSGIMYSVHVVPREYLIYFMWNPVLHMIETMRHAVAPSYPIDHASTPYFLISTLVILCFGLMLYKSREQAMLTS
ncbi:MAG: hypothetical protein RLY58_906 [Pseudomonadota bacterium]|jgi:capsular polysaccharide transport system permease protein